MNCWSCHSPNQGTGPTLLTRCCWIRCLLGLSVSLLLLWMFISVLLWVLIVVTLIVVTVITCCYSYLLLQYCLLLHIDEFIINVQCWVGKLWPAHTVHDSLETTGRTSGWQLNVDWVNCMIHTWTPTHSLVSVKGFIHKLDVVVVFIHNLVVVEGFSHNLVMVMVSMHSPIMIVDSIHTPIAYIFYLYSSHNQKLRFIKDSILLLYVHFQAKQL